MMATRKVPKHVVVIANICTPAEANKHSCVLTTSYIVFMFSLVLFLGSIVFKVFMSSLTDVCPTE